MLGIGTILKHIRIVFDTKAGRAWCASIWFVHFTTMKIIPLFPKAVSQTNLGRNFSKTEFDIFQKHSNTVRRNISNSTSLNVDILTEPELSDIATWITKECQEYINNIVVPENPVDIYVTQSWINVTNKNEQHHAHHHSNSYLSGVFYVAAKKDLIKFSDKQYRQIFLRPRDYNMFNSQTWSVEVSTGDLIIFPSELYHEVPVLNTSGPRISLAFNTWIKGELGKSSTLDFLKLS